MKNLFFALAIPTLLIASCADNKTNDHDHGDGMHSHDNGDTHHHDNDSINHHQEEFTVDQDSTKLHGHDHDANHSH